MSISNYVVISVFCAIRCKDDHKPIIKEVYYKGLSRGDDVPYKKDLEAKEYKVYKKDIDPKVDVPHIYDVSDNYDMPDDKDKTSNMISHSGFNKDKTKFDKSTHTALTPDRAYEFSSRQKSTNQKRGADEIYKIKYSDQENQFTMPKNPFYESVSDMYDNKNNLPTAKQNIRAEVVINNKDTNDYYIDEGKYDYEQTTDPNLNQVPVYNEPIKPLQENDIYQGSVNNATPQKTIDCYVIKIKKKGTLTKSSGMITFKQITSVLYSFCTDRSIQNLQNNENVVYIEKDAAFYGQNVQVYPPKHIVNMMVYRNTFFNNTILENTIMSWLPFKYIYNFFFSYYSYMYSGKGVVIYLVDSNVDVNHSDIKGRAFNMFDSDGNLYDQENLITHVDPSSQAQESLTIDTNPYNKLPKTDIKNTSKIFINSPDNDISYNKLTNRNVSKDHQTKLPKETHFLHKAYQTITSAFNTSFFLRKQPLMTNNKQSSYQSNIQCKNHGSRVATTIGGKNGGFAKDALIKVLNILDCDNKVKLSDLLVAMTYIPKHDRTVLLNMPISGPKSDILNDFLDVMSSRGIIVVTAAGNNSDISCNYSPGSAKNVINVGSLDHTARISRFSNFGGCVRIYTIGENIISESYKKRLNVSGTSFSSALVTGAVAMYLESESYAEFGDVWNFLVRNADMTNGSYLVQKIPVVNSEIKPIQIFGSGDTGWFGFYIVLFYLTLLVIMIILIFNFFRNRRRERLLI